MVARRYARGFTLLELMMVVGISSILATTFGSVMYYQVITFMERLDEADAHQTARGAFNVIRHSVEGARYGFGQDANAIGVVGIGQCGSTGGYAVQSNCTAVDPNFSDRLRTISITSDEYFTGNSPWPSAGPCSSSSVVTDPTKIYLSAAPPGGTSSYGVYAIGGNCSDANYVAATDIVFVSPVGSGVGNSCGYAASFDNHYGTAQPTLSCPTGYAKGFAYGVPQMRDFRVVQDPNNLSSLNLVLHNTPFTTLSTDWAGYPVLAYNVTQFKVSYLIDYTTPTDHRADNLTTPCADPRTVADGGTCPNVDSLGNTLTTRQLYNRIVGVQVTLGIRSPTQRAGLVGPNVVNGYRTWTYTSQFSIRNNGS